MANLHLVTGCQGSDHVTAADHGSLYAGIFGQGNHVLNRGSKLAATLVTSNKINIADGDIILQGRHIRLSEGSTVSLTISSGSQGYNRNDLIVARYTRNSSTGIEQANLVVVKGTATTGTPSDPTTYESNDLLTDNASTVDFPLYRIPISGITVGTPVQLFEVVSLALVGEDGKISSEFLPSMNYIPTSQKGAANGVAPLDSSKKISNTYLPSLSSSVNSTSTTTPANSYAVKQAYDKAEKASPSSSTGTESALGAWGATDIDFYKYGKMVLCRLTSRGSAVSVTLPDVPSCIESTDLIPAFCYSEQSGHVSAAVELTNGTADATVYVSGVSSSSEVNVAFMYLAK